MGCAIWLLSRHIIDCWHVRFQHNCRVKCSYREEAHSRLSTLKVCASSADVNSGGGRRTKHYDRLDILLRRRPRRRT